MIQANLVYVHTGRFSCPHGFDREYLIADKTVLPEEDKEELKKVEADLDAALEDADFIEQQCLELFSEFNESSKVSEESSKEDPRVSSGTPSDDTASFTGSAKKRIAHSNASNVQVPSVKPISAPKVDLHSVS